MSTPRPGDVFLTSNVPRVQLPYVNDSAIRALATVAVTTSAATIERQRALANLTRLATSGDEDAITMMTALKDLVIDNDSTVQPYDSTIERIRVGNGKGASMRKP